MRSHAARLATAAAAACLGASCWLFQYPFDDVVDASAPDAGDDVLDSGAPDAGDRQLGCSESPCIAGQSVCCELDDGGTSCTAAGSCEGLEVPCISSADCEAAGHPSYVCCAPHDIGSGVTKVECRPPSACQGAYVLCDLWDEICPDAGTCTYYTGFPTRSGSCQ